MVSGRLEAGNSTKGTRKKGEEINMFIGQTDRTTVPRN